MKLLRLPRIGDTGRLLLTVAALLAALLIVAGLWWSWPAYPRAVLRADVSRLDAVKILEEPRPEPTVFRMPFLGASMGNEVIELAVAPDARTLVTYQRFAITFWDVQTLQARHILKLHGDYVNPYEQPMWLAANGQSVAFKVYFSNEREATEVYWWRAGPEKPVLLHDNGDVFNILADGKTLFTRAHEGGFRLWDMATGKQHEMPAGLDRAWFAPRVLPDGRLLVVEDDVDDAGGLCVWDMSAGRRLTVIPHATSNACIAPDGTVLAAQHDNATRLWDLTTGREVAALPYAELTAAVVDMEFSPDGRRLCIMSQLERIEVSPLERIDGPMAEPLQLAVWDLTVSPPRRLQQWENFYATFPAGNRWLLLNEIVDRFPRPDEALYGTVWDLASLQQVCQLPDKDNWPRQRRFSPDGTTIGMRSYEYPASLLSRWLKWKESSAVASCRIQNIATQRPIATFLDVEAFGYFPDGKSLVLAKEDGTIEIWDLPPRRPVAVEYGLPILFVLLLLFGVLHIRNGRRRIRDAIP